MAPSQKMTASGAPAPDADPADASLGGRTVAGASWMIAWRMTTRLMGVASTLVLAHILVPADFGLVAMATAFSAGVDLLSSLGIQDALVRRADNDRATWNTAFTMQALRGLVTATIVTAGAWPVSLWFADPRLLPILLILAGTAVLAGFENIGVVEFRRGLRFDREFWLLLVPRVGAVTITIACALAFGTYWALIAGIVGSKVMRLGMTYVVHPFRPRMDLSRWRDLIGFSFWTWMAGLAMLVWERGEPFILGPILGAAALGVYLLASEVAGLPISEVLGPAAAALFPGVARANDRGTDTVGMALPIAVMLLLVITPLVIGISGTSGYLVAGLLGPKWRAAQPLIAIFAAMCLFSPFSFIATTVLVARGQVRRNFIAIGLAAAFMIAALCGVAAMTDRVDLFCYASVACTLVEACCYLVQLSRIGDLHGRAVLRPLLRIVVAGGATAAALYASGFGWRAIDMPAGLALIEGVVIGAMTVVGFGLILGATWLLDGRPAGPESRMLLLLRPWLRRPMRLRALKA